MPVGGIPSILPANDWRSFQNSGAGAQDFPTPGGAAGRKMLVLCYLATQADREVSVALEGVGAVVTNLWSRVCCVVLEAHAPSLQTSQELFEAEGVLEPYASSRAGLPQVQESSEYRPFEYCTSP